MHCLNSVLFIWYCDYKRIANFIAFISIYSRFFTPQKYISTLTMIKYCKFETKYQNWFDVPRYISYEKKETIMLRLIAVLCGLCTDCDGFAFLQLSSVKINKNCPKIISVCVYIRVMVHVFVLVSVYFMSNKIFSRSDTLKHNLDAEITQSYYSIRYTGCKR